MGRTLLPCCPILRRAMGVVSLPITGRQNWESADSIGVLASLHDVDRSRLIDDEVWRLRSRPLARPLHSVMEWSLLSAAEHA